MNWVRIRSRSKIVWLRLYSQKSSVKGLFSLFSWKGLTKGYLPFFFYTMKTCKNTVDCQIYDNICAIKTRLILFSPVKLETFILRLTIHILIRCSAHFNVYVLYTNMLITQVLSTFIKLLTKIKFSVCGNPKSCTHKQDTRKVTNMKLKE